MKKRLFSFLAAVLLIFIFSGAEADRVPEEKSYKYIGAMRVVWCDEWISLRSEPKKTSSRIMEIPLNEIVYSCYDVNSLFVQCEYKGVTGYALKGYLVPAPEYEPPESCAYSRKMTLDEVIGTGNKVFEWHDYNMAVIAAHEYIKENRKTWEVLRIGCFINDQPVWGHEERVESIRQMDLLKVYIGGIPDDWQVMVFDGGYGLSMLDLLSGKERWCVTIQDCPMGNAAAVAVDENGTTYIAGTDGPDPVAISLDGRVLWQSSTNDPEVFDPFEITVQSTTVQVKYRSGMTDGYKLVTFDNMGELLSIRNQSYSALMQ